MPIPGTPEWIVRWYTNWAFGICKRITEGPFGEPFEEFLDEEATCVAWLYEAAPTFLKEKTTPDVIEEVQAHLDEMARLRFGYDRWKTAKYIAKHYKEIFDEIKRKVLGEIKVKE